jgi:hypothetical protein
MIGRLLQPEPLWLKQVEVLDQGLTLWFNVEPEVRAAQVAGAYVLRFESLGRVAAYPGTVGIREKLARFA